MGFINTKKPRYREKLSSISAQKVLKLYNIIHPKEKLNYKQVSSVLHELTNEIQNSILTDRDGFKLPLELGTIFILAVKGDYLQPLDHKTYYHHGINTIQKNYDTDGLLCKICYSRGESKTNKFLKFSWAFDPCFKLKRAVSKSFKLNYKFYKFKNLKILYDDIASYKSSKARQ